MITYWKYFGYLLVREQSGVISPDPCWVLMYETYIHFNESLLGLLLEFIQEHHRDKHLVG